MMIIIIIIMIMIRRRRSRRIKKVKGKTQPISLLNILSFCLLETNGIYLYVHSFVLQYEFMVFLFSFFFFFSRGGDVRDPFFLLLFYFLKLIYLFTSPFALLQYDTKRNLMFYQSISVKHRLSVLCFDNKRVDVDNYFLCLVTAV